MSTTQRLRGVFATILTSTMASVTVAATIGACASNTNGDGATDGTGSTCHAVSPADAGAGTCGMWSATLAGDPASCGFVDSGYGFGSPTDAAVCEQLCNQSGLRNCRLLGNNEVQCGYGCPVDGRRYDGLSDAAAPTVDGLGAYFARMAFFERASVDAFTSLEAELRAHGAPTNLLRAARRAAADEVRHTGLAAAVARRMGAPVIAPDEPLTRAARSLEELARENAVEGCVREAFGALVAGAQARACAEELRGLFQTIHRDETRHAALALDIHQWANRQLTDDAIARVEHARAEALATLRDELTRAPLGVLVLEAGHPNSEAMLALYEGFVSAVHSTGAHAA